jgi:hypothetical protein
MDIDKFKAEVRPGQEPAWIERDRRYVAYYLLDEIEFLIFEFKRMLGRLALMEEGVRKLRESRQMSVTQAVMDAVTHLPHNVFRMVDVATACGFLSRSGRVRVNSVLSSLAKQGRIFRINKALYSRIPPGDGERLQ